MRAGSMRKVTGSAGWKMLKRRHGAGHTCAVMTSGEGGGGGGGGGGAGEVWCVV